MISSNFITIAIGIGLAVTILYRVRRDQLHGPFALWWLVVAGLAIVLPFFPRLMDAIARHLGVSYPPTLFLLLAISLILVKMLSMDLQRTHQEKKIRRLTQRLAILEQELRQMKEALPARPAIADGKVESAKVVTEETEETKDTPPARMGKAG